MLISNKLTNKQWKCIAETRVSLDIFNSDCCAHVCDYENFSFSRNVTGLNEGSRYVNCSANVVKTVLVFPSSFSCLICAEQAEMISYL